MTGIIHNETSDQYHAHDDISWSKLKDFIARPAYYRDRHVTKLAQGRRSDAFDLGSYLHCALLTPSLVQSEFTAVPLNAPRRPTAMQLNAKKPSDETVAAIKFWQNFDAANKGKTIIADDAKEACAHMLQSVRGNEFACLLLDLPDAEKEVTFRTPKAKGLPHGFQCKFDLYSQNGCEELGSVAIGCDVKTTAKFSDFRREYEKLGYYRQAAFYRSVSRLLNHPVERFFFIAVESVAPYGCTVFEADPESMRIGDIENAQDIERLKRCYAANDWPAQLDQFANIGLSEWKMKQYAK